MSYSRGTCRTRAPRDSRASVTPRRTLIKKLEHGAAVKEIARVHVVRDDLSRDAATQPPLSSSIHVLSVQLNAPSCVDFHEDGALPHTRLFAEYVFLVHGGVPIDVREKRPELPRRIPAVELPETFEIALRKAERAELCKIDIAVIRRGGLRFGYRRFLRRRSRLRL